MATPDYRRMDIMGPEMGPPLLPTFEEVFNDEPEALHYYFTDDQIDEALANDPSRIAKLEAMYGLPADFLVVRGEI